MEMDFNIGKSSSFGMLLVGGVLHERSTSE